MASVAKKKAAKKPAKPKKVTATTIAKHAADTVLARRAKADKKSSTTKTKINYHKGIKPGELTTSQLAKRENVLIVTVRAWINDNKIKFRKLPNGRFVIPEATFKRPIGQADATRAYYADKKKSGKAEKKPATKKSAK